MGRRMRWTASALLLAALAAGCGGSGKQATEATFQPRFSADIFTGRPIDNRWYPLQPGATFRYRGTSEGKPTRELVTVTREKKEILGVQATVVHDQVFEAGDLVEDTLDWYAQDRSGNIWYLGEATKELDHGKVTSTEGSWEAGVSGAKPGIIMQAAPHVGDSYRQEYFEGHAEDHARVVSLSASVRVPAGSYRNVQLTREWSPLERSVVDRKYYARGVGLVKELAAKGPQESLALVSFSR